MHQALRETREWSLERETLRIARLEALRVSSITATAAISPAPEVTVGSGSRTASARASAPADSPTGAVRAFHAQRAAFVHPEPPTGVRAGASVLTAAAASASSSRSGFIPPRRIATAAAVADRSLPYLARGAGSRGGSGQFRPPRACGTVDRPAGLPFQFSAPPPALPPSDERSSEPLSRDCRVGDAGSFSLLMGAAGSDVLGSGGCFTTGRGVPIMPPSSDPATNAAVASALAAVLRAPSHGRTGGNYEERLGDYEASNGGLSQSPAVCATSPPLSSVSYPPPPVAPLAPPAVPPVTAGCVTPAAPPAAPCAAPQALVSAAPAAELNCAVSHSVAVPPQPGRSRTGRLSLTAKQRHP